MSERSVMLPSGILSDTPPPLHELDGLKFQRLCQAILETEPELATCSEYGVNGESQDGIDLIAYRRNGDGIEVAQCKCNENFEPGEIRAASDEFIKYWAHWSKEDVRRFILIVACDLSTRQRQTEIAAQRRRFLKLGLIYEAWPIRTIVTKLRPNPAIVSNYLDPPTFWVSRICGESLVPSSSAAPSTPQASIIVSSVLVSKIEELSSFASLEVENRLEEIRKGWRVGRRTEAIQWLTSTKSNTQIWASLDPIVRAKILQFEASADLELTGRTDKAKQLADEALSLSPNGNQLRLRAWIAYYDTGPESALKLLELEDDTDSTNLRASILLQLGRESDALDLLDKLGDESAGK